MKRILLSLTFMLFAQPALAQFSRLDEFPVFFSDEEEAPAAPAAPVAAAPAAVDVAQPAPQPAPAAAPAEFDEEALYESEDTDHGAQLSSMNQNF